jgi:cystathionine gamma-lyase
MRFYRPIVSFVLVGREQAEGFLRACSLVIEAAELDNWEYLRAQWKGDVIRDGFISLSAGCEDSEDLIADIGRALEAV